LVVGPSSFQRLPTLLLYAADDMTVPISHGRRLAQQLPGSTFTEVAGGHSAVLRAGLTPLADWLRGVQTLERSNLPRSNG
jgi:pimeloyl-ACP methyl ester carboxylesterase